MNRIVLFLGLCFGWCVAAMPAAQGQAVQGGTLVEAMRAAYQDLDYAAAEARGQEALADPDRYTPAQLTEVHTLLGLVRYSQNRPDEARQHFLSALSLDPSLVLDSLMVSPKILAFFEEVRREQPAPAAPGQTVVLRYVVASDPRAGAALRSMLLPGWGQRYKRERSKGWALTGLWVATAGGALGAHLAREHAHDAYRTATDPADIASRYDTYNRWYRVRRSLLWAAGGVWAGACLDALVVRVAPGRRLALAPAAEGPGARLAVGF